MSNPIDEIRAINLTPYRQARNLATAHERAKRDAQTALDDASRHAVGALRTRAKKIIEPHFIEWHDGGGLSINHTDWTVQPHLSGVINPANRSLYARWARANIRFSLTGKDLQEFDEICHGLKAAADALAKMLFEKESSNV
jgi:hypothetical protein